MVVRGRVTDVAGHPIAAATIDVWQADDSGHYDSQDPRQALGNLRGVFTTDGAGRVLVQKCSAFELPRADRRSGRRAAEGARTPSDAAGSHSPASDRLGFRTVTTHAFVAGDPVPWLRRGVCGERRVDRRAAADHRPVVGRGVRGRRTVSTTSSSASGSPLLKRPSSDEARRHPASWTCMDRGAASMAAVSPIAEVDDFYPDLRRHLDQARGLTAGTLPMSEVVLAPPVPASARVICVGLNYRAHAAEGQLRGPASPGDFRPLDRILDGERHARAGERQRARAGLGG